MVSDNDDDGEKGSGAKLAALLEMSDTMDCIVVVSRWYGGIHLGPARFKHIASTARDALVESGLIGGAGGGRHPITRCNVFRHGGCLSSGFQEDGGHAREY